MRAHISSGNSKLGRIPNISLPPVSSCPADIPCAASSCCYALKAYRMYPSARAAWDENYAYYRQDPGGYFHEIAGWIARRHPAHFRWHVSGDIPDQGYLDRMKETSTLFPRLRFLAYTKQYRLDYGGLPGNLRILVSAWPGYGIVRIGDLPVAWCQDGSETRIPRDAIECRATMGGMHRKTCDACYICWNTKRDIWFRKH